VTETLNRASRLKLAAAAAVAVSAIYPVAARAAAYAWDPGLTPSGDVTNPVGSGGSGTWNTTNTNWSNGTSDVQWPNLLTDEARLGGSAGTITLGSNVNVQTIRVTQDYTLSGTTEVITLGTPGTGSTAPANIDIDTGRTLTVNAILGGANVKFGQSGGRLGTVLLNTAGTWSGSTNIRRGTLKLGVNNAVPIASTLSGYVVSTSIVDLNGFNQTVGGVGTMQVVNTGAGSPTFTVNRTSGSSTGAIQFQNNLNVVKSGAGTWFYTEGSGNPSNFVGTFRLAGGSLDFRAPNGFGNAGNTVIFDNATTWTTDVDLANVTLTNPMQVNGMPFWVRNHDAPLTLNGIISDGTTAGSGFRKTGAGLIVIGGNNTFTGQVEHGSAGSTLLATHNNAFGTTDGTLATGVEAINTGSLGLSGGITITNEFAALGSAGETAAHGAIHSYAGDNTWTGNISIPNNRSTVGAETGATLRLTGTISNGYAGYSKVGDGTVVIGGTGNNLGAGGILAASHTQVDDGTLLFNNTAGSASGLTSVEVNSGAILGGDGAMAAGLLVKSGAGIRPGSTGSGSTGEFNILGNGGSPAGRPANNTFTVDAGGLPEIEFTSAAADAIVMNAVGSAASIQAAIDYAALENFSPNDAGVFNFIVADSINYLGTTSGAISPSTDDLDETLAAAGYTQPYTYSIVTLSSGPNAGLDALQLSFAAQPVPEPATLSVLGLATMGLLARRRRHA
jgi:fibronectin-binding autotransporter adhesin